MSDWRIENCVTMVCTVACILWLYAMSGSFHSLWALLLLCNLNYPTGKKS